MHFVCVVILSFFVLKKFYNTSAKEPFISDKIYKQKYLYVTVIRGDYRYRYWVIRVLKKKLKQISRFWYRILVKIKKKIFLGFTEKKSAPGVVLLSGLNIKLKKNLSHFKKELTLICPRAATWLLYMIFKMSHIWLIACDSLQNSSWCLWTRIMKTAFRKGKFRYSKNL